MTAHLGMFRPGSTIYIPFDTFAGSTGASVTMSGLAVTDIEVYKNGSVTQRASDTGYTLLDTDGIDFDGITGIHGFSIDLSSNATADFFTAGAFYWVVVSSVTVDSQTVSFVAATFSIGYPDATLNTTLATLTNQTSFTLTAGPAEDDALNGCVVIIHDIASAVQLGHAIVADYTGSTRTVALVAGVTFTAAAGDNISVFRPTLLPTTLGRTLDVSSGGEAGVDWANVGTPGSTVSLSATTVATVSTATAVTTVNGLAANTITAAAIATGAIDADAIADNAIDAGAIASGAITAAKFGSGAIDATALATTAVDEIVDAIWDEVLTGATHNVTNSAGLKLRQLGGSIVTSGTAQAGATASITLASGASSTDGTYDPALVRIVAGTGIGQARLIIQYVGSTRVASVDRDWRTAPDNTSEYEILAAPNLISTNEGLAQGGGNTSITLNALASATNDVYVGQLVVLRTGTGQDQCRLITAYNGTTKVATVAQAWQTNPASGTGYILWPIGRSLVAAFVDDTITSGALAASAVTEIQSGLSTLTAAGVRTAVGLASANLDTQLSGIQSDTDNIQTRIPAALVSGRIDASVGAMAADTLTASALAADAVTEIQSGLSTLNAAGVRSAVGLASANLDTQLDALPTTAEVENAVWDATLADHLDSGSTGAALNAAGSAGDPWGTALPGAYGAGSAGNILGNRLVGTIATGTHNPQSGDAYARLGAPTGASVSADIADVEGKVDDLEGRLTSTRAGYLDNLSAGAVALQSSVDSLEAGVTVTTNNDKTGYALTSGERTSIADALLTRDISAPTGEPARSVLNALRFLRNRWTLVGATLTVYEEDDTTVAWTATVSTDAAADPVTGSDPS